MLETVQAVRFVKEFGSGRNRPWLLEAERKDGELVEVVCKLGSAECGRGGLVREAYCSMLAADLSLPVAEPFVVELSDEFVSSLPSSERQRAQGQGLAFGVAFAPHMLPIQPGRFLSSGLREDAASAFLFDAGVVNGDRLVTKPNCLTDGVQLLLIDHELCLNLHGRGLLVQDPWTTGALQGMTSGSSQHLFYLDLRPNRADTPKADLSALSAALGAILPSRIEEYRAAIPPEWDIDDVSSGIAQFLRELVENAPGLKMQADEVLS